MFSALGEDLTPSHPNVGQSRYLTAIGFILGFHPRGKKSLLQQRRIVIKDPDDIEMMASGVIR